MKNEFDLILRSSPSTARASDVAVSGRVTQLLPYDLTSLQRTRLSAVRLRHANDSRGPELRRAAIALRRDIARRRYQFMRIDEWGRRDCSVFDSTKKECGQSDVGILAPQEAQAVSWLQVRDSDESAGQVCFDKSLINPVAAHWESSGARKPQRWDKSSNPAMAGHQPAAAAANLQRLQPRQRCEQQACRSLLRSPAPVSAVAVVRQGYHACAPTATCDTPRSQALSRASVSYLRSLATICQVARVGVVPERNVRRLMLTPAASLPAPRWQSPGARSGWRPCCPSCWGTRGWSARRAIRCWWGRCR